jgi:L-rhamnose mutarotase
MAFRMRIQAGQEEEYLRRHRQVWPEMLNALRRAGFRNYSIHRDGLTLFAYFESENVHDTLAEIVADPVNARWGQMMSDILVLEADPTTGFAARLPEMFYLE